MVEAPTFEEARRCPICGNPGEDRKAIKSTAIAGAKLHYIYCVTQLCRWYDTFWIVQVNKDGSIPPPTNHTGEKKVYEGFEGHDQKAEELVNMLKKNAQAETQPGGVEIRNPRG